MAAKKERATFPKAYLGLFALLCSQKKTESRQCFLFRSETEKILGELLRRLLYKSPEIGPNLEGEIEAKFCNGVTDRLKVPLG